jgi:hypothetical protein
MTLRRHLAYLEAQGITPLMLREPVSGALPTPQWFDYSDSSAEALFENSSITVATPTSSAPQNQISQKPRIEIPVIEMRSEKQIEKPAEKHLEKPPAVSVEKLSATFNLSILPVGSLVLIDEMQAKGNRRLHQQLLCNIAQGLLSAPVHSNFLELNWPLNDHRGLDHSETSALSFIQVWLESVTTRQQTRLVVLFGDVAKQWFLEALTALQLPFIVVPSSWAMLEHTEQKAECWRLIRAYQSLVSAPTASNTPSN